MSDYEGGNTIAEQRDILLEAVRPECRDVCAVARSVAYDAAVFLIRNDTTIELVQNELNSVMSSCPSPESVKVCGAGEGKTTYKCMHPVNLAGESIISLLKSTL